jgi:hypothetical protein
LDANRFDTLARSLTAAGSRRRALVALSGVLGLTLGASVIEEAAAKKPCPPCKKRKKGKCKKKLPEGTACSGGTCQNGTCVAAASPAPTCTDGVKNGSETDVDCGGSCGPCANEQRCLTFTDCQSGVCAPNGTCQSCTDLAGECPAGCSCGDGGICYSNGFGDFVDSANCTACPEGTVYCTYNPFRGFYACFPRCGTTF